MIVLKTIGISLLVIWTMSLIMFFVYEREFCKSEVKDEET